MTWRMLDLFSGIGGFSLAAQWVWEDELEIVAFCEIDKYCQKVLHKHWPNVPIIEDVRDVKMETLDNTKCSGYLGQSCEVKTEQDSDRQKDRLSLSSGSNGVDLLTGGFPCQPFSVAGKRKGKEDNRFLWPEMFAVIKEIRPRWVVAENVAGIIRMALDDCLSDLEGEGYSTGTVIIPACAVNAPHRRDRVWIIANRDNGGWWKLFQQEQIKRGNITTDIGSNGKIQYMAYPESRGEISTQQSRQWNGIEQGSQDESDADKFNDNRTRFHSGRLPQFTETRISKECRSTQSRLGFSNDGISPKMDGGRINGSSKERRSEEILQKLWKRIDEENLQREVRGLRSISSQEILQSELYGTGICQACAIKIGIIETGGQIPWKDLRNLWGYGEHSQTSHRRESFERLSREYPDLLLSLSHYTPPPCSSCWSDGSWESGIPRVAMGVKERVNRLKSLGNAIVPQVAYQIFKAIKEIEMNICPHNGPKMTHSNSDIECLNCNQIIGKGRE